MNETPTHSSKKRYATHSFAISPSEFEKKDSFFSSMPFFKDSTTYTPNPPPPPPQLTPSIVFSQAFVTNLLETISFSKQIFFQFFPIYYLSSQKKHNVTPFFKQKKLMSKYIQYLLLKSIEEPIGQRCIIFNKQRSCYMWCINTGV